MPALNPLSPFSVGCHEQSAESEHSPFPLLLTH